MSRTDIIIQQNQKESLSEPVTLHGITLTIVNTFTHLAQYAEDWDGLAAKSPLSLPMLSHAWVAPYLEHRLRPGESWFCLLAHDGSTLVGVLPLIRSRSSSLHKGMCLRIPYPTDLLVEPGREDKIIPLLFKYLDQICPARNLLYLQRIHHLSPSLTVLPKLTGDNRLVVDFDGFGAFITIAGTFEKYRSRLHGNFRRNLQKGARRLREKGKINLSIHTGENISDQDLKEFIRIEGSGWKGRTGNAILLTPPKMAYYSALTRRLRELGWLQWFFLMLNDKPIAGLLAVRVGKTLIFEKMGYDENYAACSPGHLLFDRILEHIFKNGEIEEINCLSYDRWILSWQTDKRPYYNIFLFPRRAEATIFGYLPRRLRVTLRRFLHPGPPTKS